VQARKLALIQKLDRAWLENIGPAPDIEAAVQNYELAALMQLSAPEAVNFAAEPDSEIKDALGAAVQYAVSRLN